MSIESKEIKDIYALYQNLYEETARERFQRRKEEIKNPFGKTTIQTKDGKELKQGDPGFEDALKNARETVRNSVNKSLGNKKKEYGGEGSKTVLNKDGSKTTTTGHSDDLRDDPAGTRASSEKGKKILNPEKEKDTPESVPVSKVSKALSIALKDKKASSASKVITKGGPDRSGTQSSTASKGGPDRSGTQSSTAEKSKPQLGGHAKLNAQKIEKRRVEKIKANQPAPTEKDLEDAKKEADTANIAKLSGKYKEVPAPGPGNDGKTVLQKVKNPNPKDNKLDPTPIKKPVDTPIKPEISARQKWLNKTKNSPAARGGLSDDQRWAARQKHKDFKSMQAKSMMPGAKPGAAKAEFAKKHPTSNVAKDLKKSRRVTQVMDLESYDAYDLVLNYLLETNQVDTIEEANYVMTEMDGKTILEIKRLMESMPSHVRDSIGRQYGTGKYKGEKYTIEDKKNVVNWYSRIKA